MKKPARVISSLHDDNSLTTQFVITAADTKGAYEWFEMSVPYCGGPFYHHHNSSDEVLRILEGELIVKLDGKYFDLRPGDTCYIPAGVAHSYTNIYKNKVARLVGLFAPAGMEAMIEMWNQLSPEGRLNDISLAELAARYDQTTLGPSLADDLELSP